MRTLYIKSTCPKCAGKGVTMKHPSKRRGKPCAHCLSKGEVDKQIVVEY